MVKVDSTVKKETLFVFASVLILSALMQAVFLMIGKWDYTVLLGNVLSATASVLNFFLLGLTVQKCVNIEKEEAKKKIKLSQALRLLFMVVIAVLGAVLPCFNIFSTIIPLLFPRIAFVLRPLFNKRGRGCGDS